MLSNFFSDIRKFTETGDKKLECLKNLDLFVLDNSIRETTVGSLRGHTLENKKLILEEVKKCNFQYYVIESFNHENRIGDVMLRELNERGEDLSCAVAFSDVWEVIEDEMPQEEPIPIGMKKCEEFGVKNVILEIDLMYYKVDYTKKFTMDEACRMVKSRVDWIREHLDKDSKIFLNYRDFGDVMAHYPQRIWRMTNYLSSLSAGERLAGILYEDFGNYNKDLLGGWTKALKNEMERCGWIDGELLFHLHEQWGTMIGDVLEVLSMGATGIWCGLCSEGAAMGHADSCTTILNLVRLGNKKILEKFNCKKLREAAINVTKIVTGFPPPARQPIYGERAIDMVFGFIFSGISDKASLYTDGFDLADFLGIEKTMRISNVASPEMFLEKMKTTFGEDPQFTLEMATDMKAQMLTNTRDSRKEEYNSQAGLAMLFDQAGGKLTPKMAEVVNETTENSKHITALIDEIQVDWKLWDLKDGEDDDQITFDNFYKGFMAPYFGCYRCEDSQVALRCMDMDTDGTIDWFEFKTFLVWAGRQYPEVANTQQLLDNAFRKGIIPAMKDEIDRMRDEEQVINGN